MLVSCFTSTVLPVSGFSQGECYRDLQAADPSRKLIQYSLRTASTNLRSHLTGSHRELYRKVLEQKGWTEIIQRYLETRSSTTSAATTVLVPDQHDIFDEDTFHRYLVNFIVADDQVCSHL